MLSDILKLCRRYNIRLDPKLSQNFLHARHVIELEIEAANVRSCDVVLDIGAGFGFLTELLAPLAKKVYAIEVDPDIALVLRERLKNFIEEGKIELIVGDALEIDLPLDVTKIVSNPPFHIVSPLMFRLAQTYFTKPDFELAVFIVQFEFAEKLAARPGEKRSRISATIQYFAEVEILSRVSRRNFFPTPNVDSALIRMKPRRINHIVSFDDYNRVVTILFNTPNRTLRSAIREHFPRNCAEGIIQAIEKRGISPQIRIRSLDNWQLEVITEEVTKLKCLGAS
ncbi:MAG: 16S rRNA (adenine(1518)-N(6)/adenine(1519)-N(6))-dimethyltransferase RsmA [Crenarchaeota archaeon]|nr:16S rRNA (adenine(1518)-N(6)/adenine(1519)-N(6))-dimethyltransferase RsmA [Thermoproteota archaeon]MCR8500772.1 16S rRNA (adenine(1518)-N(6)/adenine(1519)-N(6))-dimethyltransferase RsmA [Thermoproteota archaeon]